MLYPINEAVSEVGEITINGNIIPDQWYIHLRNTKGKIQTNAALILADILYWYRPVPIYDIMTGKIKGYGKKFKEDLLQIRYKYFYDKFGFSESQARNALIFLEEKEIICREFRDLKIEGHILNNVMYIKICPKKIKEISGNVSPSTVISENQSQISAEMCENPKKIEQFANTKEKDWSSKFPQEQKEFLSYLLNIQPEKGDQIEKNNATWWIKHFGIEKIKMALQVYWQQVEKAKNDPQIPMPESIGKYVRKALNDRILPNQQSSSFNEKVKEESFCLPCLEKSEQVVLNSEIDLQKNHNTNTQTSMTSLSISEINDKHVSVTFKKEEENELNQSKHLLKPSFHNVKNFKKEFKKSNQKFDWEKVFSSKEKVFLTYLLRIQPEKGDPIKESHATWWIKHFGIEKIKTALQVYWQQIDKAKKNSKVPIPESIGAYVRSALNNGTQPCRENDLRNKAFAEEFKRQMGWHQLTITEKYCRAEEIGKEWHYHLPENIFLESLKSTFETCFSDTERQNCVA
jgi:hypothetical protein